MANRIPLIVDTSDGNKIKELPLGDSLDLTNSALVNATSIHTTGSITAQSVTVDGTPLSDVALSGDYGDLTGVPLMFSGSYADLTNKPTIPLSSRDLNDIQDIAPSDGDVLRFNNVSGRYEPQDISSIASDLTNKTLGDIGNVIVTGDTTNKILKYYSGAWRPANVTWTEVQSRPTLLSQFTNDVGYLTSESDSQTLSYDGAVLTLSGGNSVTLDTITADVTGTLTGYHTGDMTGSVFADDSTVMVDAINSVLKATEVQTSSIAAGTGVNLDITSEQFFVTTESRSVIDTSQFDLTSRIEGITINADQNGVTVNSLTNFTVNTDFVALNGTGTFVSTGGGFFIQHTSESVLQYGGTLEISSGGSGGTVFCGSGGNVDTFDFADAAGLRLPVFAYTNTRDIANPTPAQGTMVYMQDTGDQATPTGVTAIQVYDGSTWRNLNWT